MPPAACAEGFQQAGAVTLGEPVGQRGFEIAKALGATVIAGAGTPAKRQVAFDLGADQAVDYRAPGWNAEIEKITGGTGVDVVLEGMGPKHVGESSSILAPFGRVIVYGVLPGYREVLDAGALTALVNDPSEAKSLIGFNVGHWLARRPQASFGAVGRLLGWVADGTVTGPRTTSLPGLRRAPPRAGDRAA